MYVLYSYESKIRRRYTPLHIQALEATPNHLLRIYTGNHTESTCSYTANGDTYALDARHSFSGEYLS